MRTTKKERAVMAAVDDLYDAVHQGHREAALAAVVGLSSKAEESGDLWDLGFKAVELGWPEVAMAMIDAGKAGGLTRDLAMEFAAAAGSVESFAAFAKDSNRHEILSCAYHAKLGERDRGEQTEPPMPGGVRALCIGMAYDMAMAEWSKIRTEGMEKRWSARPKLGYERACEAWGVPVWSASAVAPWTDHQEEDERRKGLGLIGLGAEARPQQGHALGLPEEALLWSNADVESLSLENQARASDAAWHPELLAPMIESWHAARSNLESFDFKIGNARQWARRGLERDLIQEIDNQMANDIQAWGLGLWAPFMLAFANHGAFNGQDSDLFRKSLGECVIDIRNAGLVAANIDYGSFNSRMAVIAVELRRMGCMDDAATAVVAARLDDLQSDPQTRGKFEDPAFGPELCDARDYLCAQAQQALLSRTTPASPGQPRVKARL